MVLAFFTGFYIDDVLEMRPLQIAKRYFITWFLLDCVVVGSDWIVIILGGDAGGGSARLARASKTIRAIRVLRSLRLLRLMKLRKIMNDIKDRINSEYAHIMLNILKLLVMIVCICHLIACVWYGVGDTDSGWVRSLVGDDTMDIYLDRNVGFRYITCLHWSLAQFTPAPNNLHPITTTERAFATLVLLFGLIIFSSFVSSITAAMTRLRQLSSNSDTQMSVLRRYLRQHRITPQLGIRIQKYCEFVLMEQQQQIQEKDVLVLKLLSEPLAERLSYEMYEPILTFHPFFSKYSELNESAFLMVCKQCINHLYYSNGDRVFSAGKAASSMLIVTRGLLTYSYNPDGGLVKKHRKIKDDRSSTSLKQKLKTQLSRSKSVERLVDQEVRERQGVCEAVLWMPWDHVGTLIAVTVCELVSVNPDKFAMLTKSHTTAHILAQRYARSFVETCKEDYEVTDLISSDPKFMDQVMSSGRLD